MNRDFFWVKLESAVDCTPFAGPVGGPSRSYRLGYPVARQGFGFAAMHVGNNVAHPHSDQRRIVVSIRFVIVHGCLLVISEARRPLVPTGPIAPQWKRGRGVAKVGPQNGVISAVVVRIAYRFRSTSDENLPHYRELRDGCMIASVLEVKKEIPINRRLVGVDS
jgi:hypothetical protein